VNLQRVRIPSSLFFSVLSQAQSPALPESDVCYRTCVSEGIDPAFALALFAVLSDYGTHQRARDTRNWALLPDAHILENSIGYHAVYQLAMYPSWRAGLVDFLRWMRHKFDGHLTLHHIGAEYAPLTDRPDHEAAITRMHELMTQWRATDA
jgi:hypothetical protein